MPFSHHSHSGQFCHHAKDGLEEIVQHAISRRFELFALTEHAPRDDEDLYPEEIELNLDRQALFSLFSDFHTEAVRLRNKYSASIRILIGFESDWIEPANSSAIVNSLLLNRTEADARKSAETIHHAAAAAGEPLVALISSDRAEKAFDFFIGSVHHVHRIPIDFSQELYDKARDACGGTDERLFEAYFDAHYDMLRAWKPPVVGHFDLIKLLSSEGKRSESWRRWDGVWSRISRNLQETVSYGGLMEVNSAALRKGLAEPYPTLEIMEAFSKLGGRFVLSDDSHGEEQVATNYGKALLAIREAGIEKMHFLSTVSSLAGHTRAVREASRVPLGDSRFPRTVVCEISLDEIEKLFC